MNADHLPFNVMARTDADGNIFIRTTEDVSGLPVLERRRANPVSEPRWFARVNWRRLDRQATACCTGFIVLCSGMISYWIIKAIVICIARAVR